MGRMETRRDRDMSTASGHAWLLEEDTSVPSVCLVSLSNQGMRRDRSLNEFEILERFSIERVGGMQ